MPGFASRFVAGTNKDSDYLLNKPLRVDEGGRTAQPELLKARIERLDRVLNIAEDVAFKVVEFGLPFGLGIWGLMSPGGLGAGAVGAAVGTVVSAGVALFRKFTPDAEPGRPGAKAPNPVLTVG